MRSGVSAARCSQPRLDPTRGSDLGCELFGGDVADPVIGATIAPRPDLAHVEDRECLAGTKFVKRFRSLGFVLMRGQRLVAAAIDHRPGIAGRKDAAGKRDIRQVGAIGVESRIKRDRRAGQPKAFNRAAG